MIRLPIFLKLNAAVLTRFSTFSWSTSGNFWDSRLGKTLRHGGHGLLFVLIAIVIFSMIPHRIKLSGHPDTRSIPLSPQSVADPSSAIVAAHLFGRAQPKPAETTAVAASSITVDGIAAASDPEESLAILTLKGRTEAFHRGDPLPDGETLAAIHTDSVDLADGTTVRHIALANYGTADSEGPAAYAAMLRGVGLSNPANTMTHQPLTPGSLAEARVTGAAGQLFPINSISMTPATPMHTLSIVHVSPRATPLEQLRALRAQLIHPQ